VRVAAFCRLRGGEVVVSDRGRVAAAVQQELGGLALAAVGCAPQCVVEVCLGGWGLGEPSCWTENWPSTSTLP
jgi:hypothetical protein